MTCKDCIHWEICKFSKGTVPLTDHFVYEHNNIEDLCENAKDRSRFVELPYKLGDSIYEPKRHQITEYQIARIVFYDFGLRMELRLMKGLLFRVEIKQEDIGKVVFLTREEAEQALKECEGIG